MSGEVANYVIVGLVSIIAVYLLLHNREKIRLFFSSASARRTALEQARFRKEHNKAGMEDYERQVIIDILKDQLAHSRQDFSDLQKEVDALNKEIVALKNAQTKDISELKTAQIVTSNRLDGFRVLLSRIEENTRK